MLKIDMHAHILPRDWPNLNEKYGVSGFPYMQFEENRSLIYRDGQFFREVWDNSWNAEKRIEEFAQFGIQVQVLSTVPVMFSYWAQPEHALDMARFLNDHIPGVVNQYPQNYIGLGTLPLQSTDLAIAEAERCRKLDLRGVQIGSHINQWNLDAPELFPILEALQDLELALLVHPWEMMGSDSMPKYWLPWLVGMPAEQSRAICCMIFGGVLERLPRLKVCFAHGGGSFPFTIGRIQHGFDMRPDLVGTDNDKGPRDYVGKFYLDSVVHDPKALAYLIDLVGIEKLMLGTDYPFPLGEQRPGSGIDALALSDTQRNQIYSGSALEWLGIKRSFFETTA